MRVLKVLICIVFLFSFSNGGEGEGGNKSNAMEKIKSFLPTVTESAGLANAVNVYLKMSDWVRAVSAVIRSMKGAVQDIRNAKSAVEDIIQTAQSMKNFRFNNMDTWATTVANARLIVGPQTSAVLRQFGCFEAHSVGGVKDFIGDIEKIQGFDITDPKNSKRRLISQKFSPDDNASYLQSVIDTMQNASDRIKRFQAVRAELVMDSQEVAQKLSDSRLSNEHRTWSDSLLHIERRIRRIDKKIVIQENIREGRDFTTKMDTIISDCKELMAANMKRTDEIYVAVLKFEDGAADMIAAVDRVQGNKIGGMPKSPVSFLADNDTAKSRSSDIAKNVYDNTDPDKVPKPKESKKFGDDNFGAMDKKDVSTQDIVQLRGQINLYLLKQERILRDIDAMKANTLAYMMIVDGSNRSSNLAAYDALKVYARYYKETLEEME